MAYYNIAPVNLVKKYGAMEIVGLGMLLGSVMLGVLVRPFGVPMEGVDIVAVAEIVIIIIFGTIILLHIQRVWQLLGQLKAVLLLRQNQCQLSLFHFLYLGKSIHHCLL